MTQDSACAKRTKIKMAKALKELMKTTSFEKITVSDITEYCNIHRQTFYYHFQDRYELLDWLVFNELLVPFITDFCFENMYDKFYQMFSTIRDDKRFYQTALKINSRDLTNYVSRITNQQFTHVVRALGREAPIDNPTEGDDVLIAEFFGYGLAGIVMSWAQKGMKESPEEMRDKIKHLVDICRQVMAKTTQPE